MLAASEPVASWSFNEGSGRLAHDDSGHGLDGTLRGSAGWSQGVDGSCLQLDGAGHVEVPSDPRLQLGQALTIEAWFHVTDDQANTYKHIVSLWDHYLLRLDSPPEGGRLSFFSFLDGDPEPRLSAGVPSLGQWHQVFAVWTGADMELWVDGVRRGQPRTGHPTPASRVLRLGENLIGLIDEVRIYDRALSEEEIVARIPPQLVLKLEVGRPLAAMGEPIPVACLLSNTGGQVMTGGVATLTLPAGLELVSGSAAIALPDITRSSGAKVEWQIRSDAPICGQAEVAVAFPGRDTATDDAMVVIGNLPGQDDRAFDEPALVETARGDLVLGNGRLRLVFAANQFGYGVYAVDVRQADRWRRLALANALSQLAVLHGGKPLRQMVYSPNWERLGGLPGEAGVAFAPTVVDGAGTSWSGRFSFRLRDADRVFVGIEMVPEGPAALVRLQGPTLYAGERSFGAAKDDALFGGIEWLVEGESSSSDVDMHDPEHYLRYVPHPNKITVPVMGVARENAVVALLWDCLQKWDGRHDRPAAVFASPNSLDGQENHLLGLFLPSVPDWTEPNRPDAVENPYPAMAGTPLRLEAWIAAVSPAEQTLDCVPRWFEIYGVPEPTPLPRGTYAAEIDFSMRAFLESLWVEAEQKWWTSKGGGPLLSQVGLPPHFAYQLRTAALLTEDAARRDAFNARAALVEHAGGFRPAWDDLGFTWANAVEGLLRQRDVAAANLDAMGEDGAWRFRARIETEGVFAGRDYGLLGPDGAAEVGTCARRAYEILRYARLAGDADAFAAVRPALEFMRQFRVPRAAQIWECPVHAPDILAAADALEAYLEAYLFGGDREYLDEAVYWAHAGLPFVYVWNPVEQPMLRHASIAILGGSWYAGSWIGQPVQWNGLRYAYALLKLADHDSTLPWRRIAEGITVSALHQQDADGPNVALWPDNFSALDWSKCPWVFEPGMILKNVLCLTGRDVEPDAVAVGPGIRLISRARFSEIGLAEGVLRFTARFPERESGQIVVAGVARPAAVRVDGSVLPLVSGDLWASIGPAWRYDSGPGFVTIKLTGSGLAAIEVTGVAYQPVRLIPSLAQEIVLDFEEWQLLAGLPAGSVGREYIDTAAGQFARRFYRAITESGGTHASPSLAQPATPCCGGPDGDNLDGAGLGLRWDAQEPGRLGLTPAR